MAPLINFSGIASGIDTNALIQATTDAEKQTRIKPNQDKVTELTDTNKALEDVRTKLTTIQTATKVFSTLSGNAVLKSASSSNETAMTATASGTAQEGTYSVSVTQLAKNATLSFDDRFSSDSSPINAAIVGSSTVQFSIGSGANLKTASLTVDSTTTPAQLVSAFNSNTTLNSAGEASLVNVGTSTSPSYAIVVNTSNQGTDKGQLAVVVGAAITAAGSFTSQNLNQAANSQFTISGITGTITRSNNAVSDVVTGLTLNFASVGSATISVSDDASGTTDQVQTFVTAFNDLVTYLAKQNTITRDDSGSSPTNVFGPLASTQTDDDALSQVRDAIAGVSYSGGSLIKIFPDLGIKTNRDGTLTFDTTQFQTALSSEPQSVGHILTTFGDTVATTGGTIDVITRFNGNLDTTVNANKDLIQNLNDRIAEAQAAIDKQADDLRAQYANLESVIGGLQSKQQQLLSALGGLK